MTEAIPVVGQREPCPCESGKRYKNCHGRDRDTEVFIARPFEGVAGEAELVAMLELLASATCEVPLRKHPLLPADMSVTVVTVLPGSAGAVRTDDDRVVVGLQTPVHSSDRSADVARAIVTAASAPVGEFVAATVSRESDVRFQDFVDSAQPMTPTVHADFQWWHELGVADPDLPEDREAVADMGTSVPVTARIADAAFLVNLSGRTQVRMVLGDAESAATDAFARLLAASQESLGDGCKWLGHFRTCGLLAPVWDVPAQWDADTAQRALSEFMERYRLALSTLDALTSQQRQARATVVGKFVTLR